MAHLVVIFGPPASGKAAVGHALAAATGYRFFHNHLTADPAAALFGWGSERFERTVDAMRDLLFREAAADPTIPGVIFTFVWAFDLPADTALMAHVSDLFRAAGGAVSFVELRAGLAARLAREGTPFRLGLKPALRDAAAARLRQVEMDAKYRMNSDGTLPLDAPHLILDTEQMEPAEAAARICSAFGLGDGVARAPTERPMTA
jgi:hypothetical protein